jgi:fluoroquinolone transport system permease protein
MKPLLRSFEVFIKQIFSDAMLVAVCIAPIITACFFRFAIPNIEQMLCEYFNEAAILAGYYLLFDLFLSMVTPYMFCFASAMVMLTEHDENMSQYTFVTPVGKKGYIISRLLFPAAISFVYSILLMLLFSLTEWTILMILTTCLLTCFLSVIISLLVFSFSHNRIEGMAMVKLSGIVLLGLPVPFFLMSDVQYLFSPLPSFWIAKLTVEQNYLFFLPALISSVLWFWLFYRKFDHKLK